jgi:hypothetical protein
MVAFTEADTLRLRTCIARLKPHLAWSAVALTGSVAADSAVRGWPLRPLADVDFVAPHPRAVSAGVTRDFLVSHYHLPHDGYPKFLIQLVDPVARLRVDVFPARADVIARASQITVAGTVMPVLDADSLLDHKLALLAGATRSRRCDRKHLADAWRLASFCGREMADVPSDVFETPRYASDTSVMCERCCASRSPAFPLANKQEIFEILRYI